ncbi:UbiA family prenyltransferase [Actinomadura sp. ATCC 31491]|uniref:UbiA family prenyltransferase n=1 Tax=Actinomadura luzonensis TaxID=2805427 RepID=A0ABT0FVA8_9ACTN|nr:UbiA family prenyltransferase [Actinomadura luzonensis]MCK2216265.1 UbiA family prenyltransferase [Actinomadura luzonensis]
MTAILRAAVLCVAEARPLVLGVSLLRFLTGVALALPVAAAAHPLVILRGAAAWVLSILAVYLFNGVTDVVEDRINGSRRPIARGDLDPAHAMAAAAVAAWLALLATVGLPGPMLWVVAANLVLGYLYSGPPLPLKGSAGGTMAVLCLSGMLAYLGGFVVATAGAHASVPPALMVFAAAAICWMVFVGVPAKDLSDIQGDAAAGRRTLGVRVGERRSRRVMVVAALVLLVVFALTVVLLRVPLVGVSLAMAVGAAAVTATGVGAPAPDAPVGRSTRRRSYGAFMGTQHLVHLTALVCHI